LSEFEPHPADTINAECNHGINQTVQFWGKEAGTMKKIALTIAISGLIFGASKAQADQALLSEMFGRGIHAYYVGNQDDAKEMFSSAIDHGLEDPRVYYFRGILAFDNGQPEDAIADWKRGAEIEANSRTNFAVGHTLSRFQGNGRVQLESIRQTAKLAALEARMERAEQRYGELAAGSVTPSASGGITPPPVPSDIVNPFAAHLAEGSASVVDNDALKNAMDDPFAGEATAAPANTTPAANNDPFSGGNAGGSDPFGGAAPANNDPFGGNADPFGGNPFGN
jgi:tetratricopeptide (TPR) repeat protein